ncbi:AAA family ATPase [Stenotrophomonas sp. CFBP 13724]|uniref:AAA family ATPase n=1 Tax=Stenotrophomonas sp. CFBP 13724 TaxID=2775298 RepID=UPI00177BA75F|nr:AAA family ATPase [Stenotrophomonas sp. CFBP 13724]MBD8644993.1 AAA family ATPase [Stenotrophomonas sp. CFBP 13724]
MHVDAIRIQHLRAFSDARIDFAADDDPGVAGALSNIHVLLGGNGTGKSTVLRAIALGVLAPVIERDPTLEGSAWVRRAPRAGAGRDRMAADFASIDIDLRLHGQDLLRCAGQPPRMLPMQARIERVGELDLIDWHRPQDHVLARELRLIQQVREPSAFFLVAYGASRWVDHAQAGTSTASMPLATQRRQRVASLFDNRGLLPLAAWLPAFALQNPGRYRQVVTLMDCLLPAGCRLAAAPPGEATRFDMEGILLPFEGLSDGYQAYVGWIGDLLHQLCMGAPSGRRLVDNQGVVLVDEIDLHLHPAWQRVLLSTLSQALPNLQFIVTTHSPLVVGALQPSNLLVLEHAGSEGTQCRRLPERIHGQSADQVLLSPYFGLATTRPAEVGEALDRLRLASERGDPAAAAAYLQLLACGEGLA